MTEPAEACLRVVAIVRATATRNHSLASSAGPFNPPRALLPLQDAVPATARSGPGRVSAVRVFGTLDDGRKGCVVFPGVLRYFFVAIRDRDLLALAASHLADLLGGVRVGLEAALTS